MLDFKEILARAVDMGASDVHVTVGAPVKIRVQGGLVPLEGGTPSPADVKAVFDRISTETAKEKLASRGDYEFSYADPDLGRFRINAYKQRGSISIAVRLVGSRIPTPEETHLPEQLMDLSRKEAGLVVATGAAGSGKSTTLAVLIDAINHSRNARVITLEEPIEFLHRHDMATVDQREVGVDGRDYETAIRSAIKSDPDVIMIEDIEEPSVIRMAIAAAESGKLVLSTISSPSVQAAVEKMIDAFPPREQSPARTQLARVLDTVFCQQLVPDENGMRIPAFEIMNARFNAARSCIREGDLRQLSEIIAKNKRAGMLAMDDDLVSLVSNRIVAPPVASRFARDPSYILQNAPQEGAPA